MEIEKPSGYQVLEVFADTETYLRCKAKGYRPGEHNNTDSYNGILAMCTPEPFIFSGQFKNLKERPLYKGHYDCGYIKRTTIVDELAIEAFFEDLHFIYNKLKYTPVLYFHNSAYDLSMLVEWFRKVDPHLDFYYYTTKGFKHFLRGCMQSPKYNFFCEFGDTLKYDKTVSVGKMGALLGKPKKQGMPYGMCDIDIDFEQESPVIMYTDLLTGEERTFPLQEYLDYAELDVDIMRDYFYKREPIIQDVNKLMIDDYTGNKKLQTNVTNKCTTVGAHTKAIANYHMKQNGYDEGKDNAIDHYFRFHLEDTNLYQQVIESNNGGFTSFNKHISYCSCNEDEWIKCFDMNSMYPTMMRQRLPYGAILDTKPDGDYVTWHVIRLHKCKWKGLMSCCANEAFAQKKVSGVLVFYVLDEYFDFVKEHSELEYDLVDTKYQRTTSVMRKLINRFYDKRNSIKEEMKSHPKSSADYQNLDDRQRWVKLLMNSLYGKLCEKGFHTDYFFHTDTFHIHAKPVEDRYNPCILTGAYVTYKGRLALLKKIHETLQQGWTYLYSDTDSIILKCPKSADLTTVFGTDTGRLGEWKDEGTFDLYMNLLLKKKYVLINRADRKWKIAFSGVNKEFINNKLTNNFEEAVDDLAYMFNPKNNVKLLKAKICGIRDNEFNRPIIYNTDYEMNGIGKKLPVNGTVTITPEGFTLVRHEIN